MHKARGSDCFSVFLFFVNALFVFGLRILHCSVIKHLLCLISDDHLRVGVGEEGDLAMRRDKKEIIEDIFL